LITAAVRIDGERLEVAAPHPLFVLRPRPMGRLDAYPYDVSPDGGPIVVNTFVEDETSDIITLVLNWAAAHTSP
jgi:hypothetical protein